MQHLVTIDVFGFAPVPWSTPNIGRGSRSNGTTWRFATYSKKTNVFAGKLSMKAWQASVRSTAKEAMAAAGHPVPVLGPVCLDFTFFSEPPDERQLGDPWWSGLTWSKKTNGFVKKKSWTGTEDPDLTNMIKSTEDAMSGEVYYDDAQVKMQVSRMIYGRCAGARISVFTIEPEDNFSEWCV